MSCFLLKSANPNDLQNCESSEAAKQFVGCRKVNSKKKTPGDNRNIVPLCVLKGENLMLRQTIAELIVLFFCYSVAGWCMEVILKYIQFHRFINRGFLIGPYCPIYGSGEIGRASCRERV